tara:strand:- start:22 stop:186 length:165 start_codon:yes stop_codon:yes gene_type:complete
LEFEVGEDELLYNREQAEDMGDEHNSYIVKLDRAARKLLHASVHKLKSFLLLDV